MAGSIGEFNAHAANILTAVFFGCWTGPSSKCGEFELYDIVSSFLFYCFYSKTHLLLQSHTNNNNNALHRSSDGAVLAL